MDFSQVDATASVAIGLIDAANLTTLVAPNNLTTLGNLYAGLLITSVAIPAGVTSFSGTGQFSGCTSLQSITNFPTNVTEIPDSMCYNCSALTSFTIPSSVTKIGISAFYNCNFTSITVPSSCTEIGGSAFNNCSSLTSITLAEGITTLGGECFKRCSSLESLTIPDSVTTITQSNNASDTPYFI